ncbi:MAG: DUF5329 family protein [Verrucomicrobia bacterium]|nr:DUF5329 family protein [Verrucomicrobiota bacterium]MCH8527925.1 DUF5329 family protein [Kiritimatiellia bacterium]
MNLILLAGLLLAGISLLWRSGQLVGELHGTLVAISEDLKDVSTVAGTISRDVETLRTQVEEIREKVDDVVPREQLQGTIADAQRIRDGLGRSDGSLPAEEQEHIEALLRRLAASDLRYESRRGLLPVEILWGRIQTRYLSMRNTLTSAEEFIDVVATRSMLGVEYRVTEADGGSLTLREWMHGELVRLKEPE